jgi:hypothetical protein
MTRSMSAWRRSIKENRARNVQVGTGYGKHVDTVLAPAGLGPSLPRHGTVPRSKAWRAHPPPALGPGKSGAAIPGSSGRSDRTAAVKRKPGRLGKAQPSDPTATRGGSLRALSWVEELPPNTAEGKPRGHENNSVGLELRRASVHCLVNSHGIPRAIVPVFWAPDIESQPGEQG